MNYTADPKGFYRHLQEIIFSNPVFDYSEQQVLSRLEENQLSVDGFAALLSPEAEKKLEVMACKAQAESLRHFGKTVEMFAPLYLANICQNKCVYCGFHVGQKIERNILDSESIRKEAKALADIGHRRILVLTGEAPQLTGAKYIADAVKIVAEYVPSVGIEVHALTEEEYFLVTNAGADSMTMFQETYNEEVYASVHLGGPKKNFFFRLDAPHRAVKAGMRSLTFGVLLGLTNWRLDVFLLGMHVLWISKSFPDIAVNISLPRIRARSAYEGEPDNLSKDALGYFYHPVTDKEFVQAITALRCFIPHAGITLSTRESAFLRDHLIPLGVTRVSAGVSTGVGGYVDNHEHIESSMQFKIEDSRSLKQVMNSITNMGYQPVLADWLLPETDELASGIANALGIQKTG